MNSLLCSSEISEGLWCLGQHPQSSLLLGQESFLPFSFGVKLGGKMWAICKKRRKLREKGECWCVWFCFSYLVLLCLPGVLSAGSGWRWGCDCLLLCRSATNHPKQSNEFAIHVIHVCIKHHEKCVIWNEIAFPWACCLCLYLNFLDMKTAVVLR